jgi:hypothetical protein
VLQTIQQPMIGSAPGDRESSLTFLELEEGPDRSPEHDDGARGRDKADGGYNNAEDEGKENEDPMPCPRTDGEHMLL